MNNQVHVPVLLERVVALLAPALESPASVLIDATLGLGGHAEAVLRDCPNARVVGIDRDPQALDRAGARLATFGDRVTLVHAVYDQIPQVLADLGLERVQGVLFDLGVSSMQLDLGERGFAYAQDAPLDMRMDSSSGITAAEVLNSYSFADLAKILKQYGEERFARQIAKAIVKERDREPFTNSARLVDLLRNTLPAASQRTGGHPAKRTFQALRIAVNDELRALDRLLAALPECLASGGRVVILTFHSGEDRLVKKAFQAGRRAGVYAEVSSSVTRSAKDETFTNRRAAAAKLRWAVRA